MPHPKSVPIPSASPFIDTRSDLSELGNIAFFNANQELDNTLQLNTVNNNDNKDSDSNESLNRKALGQHCPPLLATEGFDRSKGTDSNDFSELCHTDLAENSENENIWNAENNHTTDDSGLEELMNLDLEAFGSLKSLPSVDEILEVEKKMTTIYPVSTISTQTSESIQNNFYISDITDSEDLLEFNAMDFVENFEKEEYFFDTESDDFQDINFPDYFETFGRNDTLEVENRDWTGKIPSTNRTPDVPSSDSNSLDSHLNTNSKCGLERIASNFIEFSEKQRQKKKGSEDIPSETLMKRKRISTNSANYAAREKAKEDDLAKKLQQFYDQMEIQQDKNERLKMMLDMDAEEMELLKNQTRQQLPATKFNMQFEKNKIVHQLEKELEEIEARKQDPRIKRSTLTSQRFRANAKLRKAELELEIVKVQIEMEVERKIETALNERLTDSYRRSKGPKGTNENNEPIVSPFYINTNCSKIDGSGTAGNTHKTATISNANSFEKNGSPSTTYRYVTISSPKNADTVQIGSKVNGSNTYKFAKISEANHSKDNVSKNVSIFERIKNGGPISAANTYNYNIKVLNARSSRTEDHTYCMPRHRKDPITSKNSTKMDHSTSC